MRYVLCLSCILLTIFPICSEEQIDEFEMLKQSQTAYYRQIVERLALLTTNQSYNPKFTRNIDHIHAIVPADFLFVPEDDAAFSMGMNDDNKMEFSIVAIDDWSRILASGFICHANSLEECLKRYAWRFATSSMPIDLSKRKKIGCWGNLCIVHMTFDEQTRTYPRPRGGRIELFRNGIWVSLSINDASMTSYPQFLDALDALLCHDPDKPFVPPAGFSESAYQENLRKYRAWLQEKEKKESEQREREWAKLHPEETRPPERPRAPLFVWTDEIAASGKELMRKWFPDSPEELGTWRGGYAAAPGNPLSQRVTAESLRGRFPIVSPLSPRYGREDAFHVCLSSRDGKERCAVAVLHARSAAEAREALAWLCLTGGDCGGLRKIGGEPARFKKRPSLAIGDFCVSNQGEVREDGTVAPGGDEREIYFLRGNTAAMVRALPPAPGAGAGAAPGGSAVATAKRLDGIIKEALAAGQ